MTRSPFVHLVMLNEVPACERAGRKAQVSEGTGAVTCPRCRATLYYAGRRFVEEQTAAKNSEPERLVQT